MSELSSRQVRALILLLILAPLIPTTLMLRLMINSVEAERIDAQQRTSELYQQALRAAGVSFVAHLDQQGLSPAPLPQRVLQFYARVFDREVAVRVIDAKGQTLAGAEPASAPPVAEESLEGPAPGWRVQLIALAKTHDEALADQIRTYSWATVIAVVANLSIAGVAGYALVQQTRLQELKSNTLATVSHELKTPLAAMRILIDTLDSAPGRLPEYLPLLAQENARLLQVTENFLSLARWERGMYRLNREPVAASLLIEGAVDALRARMEVSHPILHLEIADHLPDLLVDKAAMTIALVNLLDNSLKYMSHDKEITLRALVEGRRMVLEIADQGIGIPKSEQRQIFTRFYQVDRHLARTHEGCGLGLSIVKAIVEAHGGTIRVSSAEGVGSTFRIELALPA